MVTSTGDTSEMKSTQQPTIMSIRASRREDVHTRDRFALMWLRMATVAKKALEGSPEDKAFYEAKLTTAAYFGQRFLPDAGALRRKLEAGGEVMMALDEEPLPEEEEEDEWVCCEVRTACVHSSHHLIISSSA